MSPHHVLVVGAGGFIGSRIVARLPVDGHRVTCAGRDPAALRRHFPGCPAVRAQLGTDGAATWAHHLDGVDAVVNAAGIRRGELDAVQRRGPLFDARAAFGVPRVVQVSALGAGVVTSAGNTLSDDVMALRAALAAGQLARREAEARASGADGGAAQVAGHQAAARAARCLPRARPQATGPAAARGTRGRGGRG